MESRRLDALARLLTGPAPRRRVLGALAAGVLAPVDMTSERAAGAASCLPNGRRCKRGKQCCSGRCAGKKGKKRCRQAPGQSICTVADEICRKPSDEEGVDCGVGAVGCGCHVTSAGHAFCADDSQQTGVGCDTDVDCVAALGRGVKCVRIPTGRCNLGQPQKACFRPCGDPI